MFTLLHDLIFDYTLRNVALGSMVLGIISGVLGCFAVLRRQGLLGDALAHAALPGICFAYMLTGSKETVILLAGAALSAWLGTLLLLYIVRATHLSEDTALGTVLSTFFGLGIVLLTFIAKSNDANQAGLDKYLFGQAATLVWENVLVMGFLGSIALVCVAIFYKELKLLVFDPTFAASLGLAPQWLNVLLTSLIVIAVVIGLQTVGVVLMAAMLIGPALAARQWTNRLSIMIGVAALIGVLSGLSGALISVSQVHLPTGPMVILSLTVLVTISLLFAPAHGMVWEWLQQLKHRRALTEAATAQSDLPSISGGNK
jgi:manganese/zinc/iron transport system permease protein